MLLCLMLPLCRVCHPAELHMGTHHAPCTNRQGPMPMSDCNPSALGATACRVAVTHRHVTSAVPLQAAA